MTRETMSELPPPSDTPTLHLLNNPRRVLDTGLAIFMWIAFLSATLLFALTYAHIPPFISLRA
jgi:hypothetical protein